jgi:hypothetical protein
MFFTENKKPTTSRKAKSRKAKSRKTKIQFKNKSKRKLKY